MIFKIFFNLDKCLKVIHLTLYLLIKGVVDCDFTFLTLVSV